MSNARELSKLVVAGEVQAGAMDTYATIAELPLSGVDTGTQAYVAENNRLYIFTGTGWFNIALVNTAPTITSGGAGSYQLATDGTPTVVTLVAEDPEGIPITWSYSVTSGTLGATTVVQADNVFTITPSTNTADVGSFEITFTASDGVNIATDVNSFSLLFISALWDETVLSISTSSTNSLNNSTFIDRSTNAHTVTTSGSPVQSAFHPYLDNWSVEFDGTDDYLTFTDTGVIDFGTNDWTVEFWANVDNTGTFSPFIRPDGTGNVIEIGHDFSTNKFKVDARNSAKLQISYTFPENAWTHVAIVKNNGTLSVYINGTSIGSVSDGTTWVATNGNCRIGGSSFSSSHNINGNISNLRIVKETAVYTENFTPPTENLTAITGTTLLTCQSNRFVDNSTNGLTLTPTGNTKISSFNPFGQESEYAVGENKGSFYSPTNSNQWLRVTAPDTSGNIWECQGWFYLEDFSNWGETSLFSTLETTNVGMVIRIFGEQVVGGAWTKQINIYGRNATPNVQTSTLPIYEFSWFHVLASCDGTNTRIFLNGVEVLSLGVSNWGGHNLIQMCNVYYSNNNAIGYYSDFKFQVGGSVTTSNFTPPTSPVGNTNAALYLPMDNAGIYDKTGNNTLTLVGNTSTSTTQTKFADTAMYFDGTGDYVDMYGPGLNLSSNVFTIEAWVYRTGTGNMQNLYMAAPPHNVLSISLNRTGGGNTYVYVGNGSSWTALPAINSGVSSPIGINTWAHVALTCDGTTLRLFHDGTLVGSSTTLPSGFQGYTRIGAYELNGTAGEYLTGYVEDFQIINGVTKYTTNFTPPNRTQGRIYQAES